MSHPEEHPFFNIPGCWKCRMGVGRPSAMIATQHIRQGSDPVRNVPVRVEEGAHRGKIGGHHTEHMDGRQDAKVYAPQVRIGATEVR